MDESPRPQIGTESGVWLKAMEPLLIVNTVVRKVASRLWREKFIVTKGVLYLMSMY